MKITHSIWSTSIFLLIISSIFLITRLYLISAQPPSLYWDEASIGYNAFSILTTGKDEWGQTLPIHFRAFNEYKLPVYIYSVVLSEFALGNTIAAIRLPAVVFSFGSMFLIFFISEILFKRRAISLLGSFIFTISPWFFIFSRTGYEVTAGLFFFLLGTYCLLRIRESSWFLLTAAGSFVCAMYSYNSFRVLVPIFSGYFVVYLLLSKQLGSLIRTEWKKVLLAILVFILGILPIINLYRFDGGLKRFSDTTIFSPAISFEEKATGLFYNYLQHFSPQFLFLSGDQNIRSHTGNVGEIFWIQSIFIIVGLIYVLKRRSIGFLVLGLLIIAPIPASIARESPHSLRAALMIVPLTILSAAGVVALIDLIKWKQFGYGIVLTVFCLLFSVYFGKFINFYHEVVADSWQYGYKETFTKYGPEFSNYDYVLVSDRYVQPYIFYLEYLSIRPDEFMSEKVLNVTPRVETSLVKKIGNVEFGEVHFADLPQGKSLVFAHPSERLTEIMAKDVILNPDKTVALYVYEYKK